MRVRAGFCLLVAILLANSAHAFDRTLFNTTIYPHEGFHSTELVFNLPGGTNVMQTYLLSCDIGDDISCVSIKQCGASCPPQEGTLLDEREISNTGKIDLYINSEPGLYKICSRLKQDPYYYDCWPDKYFFLMDRDVVVETKVEYVYENITKFIEKKEPYVNIYSLPTIVDVGQDFTAKVFFNNPSDQSVSGKVYTFSFHEGDCITTNCWDDYANITLYANSWKEVEFSNSFLEFGNFTFKARLKIGNDSYTDMMTVQILPKKMLDYDFVYNNTHVGYSVWNSGNIEENFTIISINSNTSEHNITLEPNEKRTYFVNRTEGWIFLFNNRELLDSRPTWEYQEKDTGPTSFFVANPNDLNIPLVLVSLIAMALIVWKI